MPGVTDLVYCFILLTIFHSIEPVCGKMCGQIISSVRQDNLIFLPHTGSILGDIVSEYNKLTRPVNHSIYYLPSYKADS